MASAGAIVNSGMANSGPKSEPTQLALALDHAESLAREDFLAGPSNDAALGLIERWPDWPSRTVLLRGPEGSGKSHLAAIWARESGARTLSPRALEGAEVPVALATGALLVVALTAPDDALFRAVLVKLFSDRQLAVDESLVSFLTTRIERSFAAARTAVARLDREALRLRRPVTRTLAGE